MKEGERKDIFPDPETRKERKGKLVQNPELVILAEIDELMETLEADAAWRVISWLADRYGVEHAEDRYGLAEWNGE